MFINSKLASDGSLVTCANKDGAPCRAQCANFSKGHMTDKVWRDVLFVPRDRQRYFIEKRRAVSLYPSPGSDGTMLTREDLGEAPRRLVMYSAPRDIRSCFAHGPSQVETSNDVCSSSSFHYSRTQSRG